MNHRHLQQPDAGHPQPLAGLRVAFTGRLASLTRVEAAQLVAAYGGRISRAVNWHTSLLVVGQDGLPLGTRGNPTLKLQSARRLVVEGATLEVCSEEEFLGRLGLHSTQEKIHRLYSAAQVVKLLGISGRRLRRWVRSGLIRPAQSEKWIHYFDFAQVSAAKTLSDLTRAGVSAKRIRRSLRLLSRWIEGADQPLENLRLVHRDGRLLLNFDDQLAEPDGQMHLDFEQPPASVPLEPDRTAEACFLRGCEHEDQGRWQEAIEAYRQALLLGGPSADACFNLANVLYAVGEKTAAAERYRQAIEIDPQMAEGWNNLGIVLAELKRCDEAVWALRRAVEIDPDHADAHFNLADCLEASGCTDEAQAHWRACLKGHHDDPWADFARGRLDRHSSRRR